ncbi:MAG: inositol monophosphatase [Candidatus Omnitrophica bacterium]|nr:inositol monophosphatase [Candidatus Omnitrophota bacterium]
MICGIQGTATDLAGKFIALYDKEKQEQKMKKRFSLAKKVVKEAGAFLNKQSYSAEISSMSAYDVKLRQDIESEKIILNEIIKNFPDDGYISEEKGEKQGKSGYLWIIDPLDGTVNYYRGIPHCSISIACLNNTDGFGVVYNFFSGEMFTAQRGYGAFLNGHRIEVSKTDDLKDVILGFGLMKGKEEIQDGLSILSRIADRVKKIRMMGSAALDICYVAAGRIDIFLEVGLNIWDIAAGKIILEEAGGVYKVSLNDSKKLFFASNRFINVEWIWQNH